MSERAVFTVIPVLLEMAWCPRFASVFWTLTWAEEGSGQPTERFQLTPYTRIQSLPDHIGMNRIYTPEAAARCGPSLAQKKGEPGAPGTRLLFNGAILSPG